MRTDVPVGGTAPWMPCRTRLPMTRPCTRNRETVATESTHPKTLKSSRGPRRGSRLGLSWLWWGGWRCGQWLRGWWGWKLRGGGCSSRSRRPLRGISLPLSYRSGGVNNSPARVPRSFRLCPALHQLMHLSPCAVCLVHLFPISVLGPGYGEDDAIKATRGGEGAWRARSPRIRRRDFAMCTERERSKERENVKRARCKSHALLCSFFSNMAGMARATQSVARFTVDAVDRNDRKNNSSSLSTHRAFQISLFSPRLRSNYVHALSRAKKVRVTSGAWSVGRKGDEGRRCATIADPLGVQRPARSNIVTCLARRDGSREKKTTVCVVRILRSERPRLAEAGDAQA